MKITPVHIFLFLELYCDANWQILLHIFYARFFVFLCVLRAQNYFNLPYYFLEVVRNKLPNSIEMLNVLFQV